MASFLRIERVTALPDPLTASTMYIVKSATAGLAEVFVTGTDVAEVRHIVNKNDIQAMINTSVADFNNIQVVADNAARDALVDGTRNFLVLSLDATADATVNAGAALYVFDKATMNFTKVSEFESMDITLTWDAIQGKPTSTVADIDDAVTKRHTHANKVELDKIGQDANGNLTYDGAYPKAALATAGW